MKDELRARFRVERLLMLEYRKAMEALCKAECEFGHGLATDELISVRRLEEALDALQAWDPKP